MQNNIYVVIQDFFDNYGGGGWEKSFYQTKDDAIKVLEEAKNEGQCCDNDFVLKLESFDDINNTIDISYYEKNKETDSAVVAYFVDNYDDEDSDDELMLVIKEDK
tara:strand:+ start:91 stop:405 length:315 start_codon:yes stop_codon:yes gene_type:complete